MLARLEIATRVNLIPLLVAFGVLLFGRQSGFGRCARKCLRTSTCNSAI